MMPQTLMTPSSPNLHIAGGVATITLNRPAQRNRLDNNDLKTLLSHFESVNQNTEVRVLVLTANTDGQPKPVFCAGYDIGGFNETSSDTIAFEKVPDALAKLRPITVCALNGSVYGGATDLVLACDLRLGLKGIEWRMPATALGLHYYASGLHRYIHRFGISATKRAFLTARPFTWEDLEKLGLFEEFLSMDEWATQLGNLTTDVLALAPLAAQETKKSLNEIITGQMDLKTLQERELLTSQSADFLEGRTAFMERRKPSFKGS